MAEEKVPVTMPALALRGLSVFPSVLLHFDVSRGTSIRALDEAMASNSPIFLVAQRDLSVEEPEEKDLFTVGTVCNIRQILRMPGDNVRVMVEGESRGKLLSLKQTEPYLIAEVVELAAEPPARQTARTEALIRNTYELFDHYIERSPRMTSDLLVNVLSSQDPGYIADYIAQNIPMRMEDKQTVLEEIQPVKRLRIVRKLLQRETEVLELEQDLESKTRQQISDTQKDFMLRQQLKVIQDTLGEGGEDDECAEYRQRIDRSAMPEESKEKLRKEVSRLEKQPYGSAEAAVSRGYLDTCLDLPWGKRTKDRVDVAAARKILDADHYGLEKVKERILEFLAVKQLAPDLKSQILCLVGPPGVGKTSIALSVAKATRRKLARVSLGGVHDEAEIRGHRKTYVGSMPGRIITAVNQAGSCNPLLVLDEIDKLTGDQRGDPASALLEVLDPEQNASFRDNFLEIPFDLSEVMFITTANTTDTIPRPLLDRMEVIELPSYTDEEKLEIAKRHLLPKQLKRHGLKKSQLKLTDSALRALIAGYTKESGVRVLERQLASLCRKAAMRIVSEHVKFVSVTEEDLASLLGPRKYHPELKDHSPRLGVVNGLAWTQVGGELLEVEANVVPGTGKLELTGNLGDVMKESCQAALSYIRAHAAGLGVESDFYKTKDIHLHFPEGAVPKDGPSAGVSITTAMVSALTGVPVRGDIAMTGEITLQGRVLAIGGLREKTMGALREGVRTVLIPEENLPDLEEIDPLVRKAIRIVPVSRIDQVLEQALLRGEQPKEELALMPISPAAAGELGRTLTQ